jgi:hypothetical protein
VTVCVLVALTVSRRFSKSIYESIILSRRLPYLPTLKDKVRLFAFLTLILEHSSTFLISLNIVFNDHQDLDSSIFSIIDSCPASVPKVCPVSTMIRVLSKNDQSVLPVVLGVNNPLFVGSIQRQQLESCVIEALRVRSVLVHPCQCVCASVVGSLWSLFEYILNLDLANMCNFQCAIRELDTALIRVHPSAPSSSSSSSASPSGVELVDSSDSDSASSSSSSSSQQRQSREEHMTEQRDLLSRLCKMALDPMHKTVLNVD